jgi:hypothetical protein
MIMGLLFKNDLFDQFGTWPLGYIPYGGADFGEIQAIAQAVGDGDETTFYNVFTAAAGRFVGDAHELLSKGKNDRLSVFHSNPPPCRHTLSRRLRTPTPSIAGFNQWIRWHYHGPLYDKLTCEKQFLAFPASRGAGDHCEMTNRSLLNRKVFDWLDSIL